jgi:Tfp pilus assembly protein PilO
MNELTKRDKILLGLLIAILVAFLYYRFLLSPSLEGVSNIKAQVESNQQKEADLENKKILNVQLKKSIAKLETKKDKAEIAITVGSKDGEIVKSLNSLSTKNNVSLSGVTFSTATKFTNLSSAKAQIQTEAQTATVPEDTFMSLGATIEVNGTLSSIINYIDDLEHEERIANVSNVSISQNDSAYKVVIAAQFFYFTGNGSNN